MYINNMKLYKHSKAIVANYEKASELIEERESFYYFIWFFKILFYCRRRNKKSQHDKRI